MKKLIALLLIATQAWAGLPPTSVQGQKDTSPQTKFNFQVPYNQKTDLGGIKALFETGNKNLLQNASFEDTSAGHFWTVTGASSAVETTNIADGKQSLALTLSAVSGDLMVQDVTPTIQTSGVNMEATCWVKTSLTDAQVCVRTNGAVTTNCTTAPSTSLWTQVVNNFPGPANGTSVGVEVKNTASDTGTIYVDDCYVGVARNILPGVQPTSNWTSYTPTFAALGTVSGATAQYRRVGDTLEVHGTVTAGTTTSGGISVSLPSGLSMDTTKISTAQAVQLGSANRIISGGVHPSLGQGPWILFYDGSDATVLFVAASTTQSDGAGTYTKQHADQVISSGQLFSFYFAVPVTSYGASSALQNPDQSDFGWVSCDTLTIGATVTPPTKGTNSQDHCEYRRVGDTMEFQYDYVQTGAGSAGSGTYLFPIPNSLAIDTAKLRTTASNTAYPVVGSGLSLVSTFFGTGSVVAYDSTHLVLTNAVITSSTVTTFGAVGSSVQSLGNASVSYSLRASFPISGWANTNRAPNLIGSVTNSSPTGGSSIEAGQITCSSSASIVSQLNGSTWLSTVGNVASGVCAVTFTSGRFSATPYCWADLNTQTQNQLLTHFSASSSTAAALSCTDNSTIGTACTTFTANVFCIGAK